MEERSCRTYSNFGYAAENSDKNMPSPTSSSSAPDERSFIKSKPVPEAPHYLSFDLEIAKVIPGDFNQWKTCRPLGISCAATQLDGEDPVVWYSSSNTDQVAMQMTTTDLEKLIAYLEDAVLHGHQILTWNGLGFDFDVLAEESGCWDRCSHLALNHIDMMFHFFCLKGFPLALDAAAKGLGLPGKPAGMTGANAPELWQRGAYQAVLDYVAQDARTTLAVAKAAIAHRGINWTSKRGLFQHVDLPAGWLPVSRANELPLPDTGWMSQPMKRSEYLAWTRK